MKRWGRAGNPKIKKNIHLLGTMPDEEFAKLVGCHPQYPYFLRRKRGMLCSHTGCLTNTYIDWETFEHLFGQEEDRKIAEIVGCTLSTVARQRQKRKIRPFFRPRTCPCGTSFQPRDSSRRYCCNNCQRMHWYYLNVRELSEKKAEKEMYTYANNNTI